MSRKSCFVFSIVLPLLFLQGTLAVSAQTKPAESLDSEVRPFSDMTLEIALPEQTVLALQPIPIIVKQVNNTNQPVMGYGGIEFGLTPIAFYVKRNGSNERVSIGHQSPVLTYLFVNNNPVAPGKSSETKGLITMGLKTHFPEPGIYEIQAELSGIGDGSHRIKSNKVSVEIKTPTGINSAAYNLIKNSPRPDFFFNGAQFDQLKDILETLTVMHPNTPYAKNSAYVLGRTYFGRKQYAQALTNFIRLENDNNFIFREKVREYLRELRRVLQIQQTTERENQ